MKQEQYWQKILSSGEVQYYIDYSEKREKSGSEHEFLKIKDSLYQNILANIAVNTSSKTQKLQDELQTDIPDLLSKLQEEYKTKIDESKIWIATNEQYQHYTHLLQSNEQEDKRKIYQTLVKDLVILSGEQLDRSHNLSKMHIEELSELVYKTIISYKKERRGSHDSDRLDLEDKYNIASNLYAKINNKDWWKNLSQKQMNKIHENEKRIEKDYVYDREIDRGGR